MNTSIHCFLGFFMKRYFWGELNWKVCQEKILEHIIVKLLQVRIYPILSLFEKLWYDRDIQHAMHFTIMIIIPTKLVERSHVVVKPFRICTSKARETFKCFYLIPEAELLRKCYYNNQPYKIIMLVSNTNIFFKCICLHNLNYFNIDFDKTFKSIK